MGSFFTNVQVRAGARGVVPLLDALRAHADEAGLEVLAGDAGEADRTIVVLPPDAGGWTAVYDEATESQNAKALDALGALASRALDAPAFSVLVHDSDVLDLCLYERGACVDRYDSHPGYFGERVTEKQREALAGQPAKWGALLVAGQSPDALRAVWSAEDLFAERTLARTCELLGCEPARAQTGFRYLTRDALPEGAIALRLRARARPAYEQPAEGPPVLEAQTTGEPTPVALAVGDELRVPLTTISAGGASTGLSVRAWGSALEQGLVELERFELLVGDRRAGAKHQMLAPERRASHEAAALYVADRADQAIPAGLPGGTSFGFAPGMDVRKMMEARTARTVHVNAVGRVVRDGRGELGLALVPTANFEGAGAALYALTVDPPLPKPLRVRALEGMPGGSSHLLRPLLGARFLVALAAIDAPRARGSELALDALDATLATLGAHGDTDVGVFHLDAQRRPKVSQGEVGSLLQGKGRAALARAMTDEMLVTVTVREGAAFERARGLQSGRWGMAFGTGALADREDDRVPTLTLWADADAIGEETTARLREQWSALLARAMDAGGAQGVLLRSGWTPAMPEHTAYETACGIDGRATTTRAWVARWVRVPGNDRLWLGPALTARLGAEARARLAEVADVEARGQGLAISLREPAQARALEEALAELLPSEQDAHAANAAWYAAARKKE